jgi:hypothetical protein
VNVINWLGLASHFTFRKHTAKIWGLAGSVMYITDRAAWGAHNPNLTRPVCAVSVDCEVQGFAFQGHRDVASSSQ